MNYIGRTSLLKWLRVHFAPTVLDQIVYINMHCCFRQNLSTYKELCSIANDLNQPDLIYKFMHLANHNAMWNSKKGAAFGFSSIAAQAGEQLAPFLSKIVPKMYRYQFDPNPKIQQAMSSIWNALVTNTKETVDKYMLEIMDDLLVNLTSNQWRVRESRYAYL